LSGLLNLVGAFLSLAVAATIASGLVNTAEVTLQVVAAGLAGGIIWNLLTWLFGIPSSSSHALIGGVIGSTLAAAGGSAVQWKGLVSKVVIPAALSPIIAALVAALGTWLLYRISRSLARGARNHGFRIGQVGSACMVSLAHGTNDAQKTMGVITLALIANGTLPTGAQAPFWVILSCALAISIGTYLGGWRVIRTLGKGLVEIESPQGMAAESSSAAIILLSASFGYSLSTTHVATGSIIGTGLGKKGADVRWNVAGRMATAWLFTLMVRRGRSVRIRARDRGLRDRKAEMGWINLSAIWKIVVFGVLAGAGLPALFAIGLRALAMPGNRVQTAGADSDHVYGGNVLGLVIGAICFLIILAALGWGIYEVYQIGHPAPAKH
jgi:PiT family inorganic phosphate transporter